MRRSSDSSSVALLEHKLEEVKRAIDEYQATNDLTAPPAEVGKQAVTALEAILARGEHKARLVEILRPMYERADDWKKLVALNEERLAHRGWRLRTGWTILRETARLYEKRGGDAGRAFDSVRTAFVLDPEDGDTRGELDRLAEATKRWDDLADAYEQGIAKTEGVGQRELLGALARVHDRRRDDPRHALEAWDRLFKQDERSRAAGRDGCAGNAPLRLDDARSSSREEGGAGRQRRGSREHVATRG